MLAKFAEDERLEQMNAQKRRMRQAEHAREVQRLIDEKRRAFEEAKAREEAAEAAKWVCGAGRQAAVGCVWGKSTWGVADSWGGRRRRESGCAGGGARKGSAGSWG